MVEEIFLLKNRMGICIPVVGKMVSFSNSNGYHQILFVKLLGLCLIIKAVQPLFE